MRGHILIFLAEKRFFGCGGLEITDAMRVLIAAQACLPILNRKTDYYRKLRSILVYPSAFLVNRELVDEAGVHTSWREPRIGESWEVGRVTISWDEVEPEERDLATIPATIVPGTRTRQSGLGSTSTHSGMEPLIALLLVAVLSATVLLVQPALRARRRERLRSAPFPTEWERILIERLRLYPRIPDRIRQDLRGHILIFLAEKRFFGCGGLEITDAMRVLIAAQACLLILNRKTDYYRKLRSILVYPSAFIVNREIVDEAGVHTSWREPRIGESWEAGRVVISWDEVEPDESDRGRGENVVLHEFAHQLDEEDGIADGTPVLGARARYEVWAQVLGAEYRTLREKVTRGEATLIDPYGAENAGEFFASATECFFERPGPLCEQHPTLYATLRDYYRVDPAVWHGGEAAPLAQREALSDG